MKTKNIMAIVLSVFCLFATTKISYADVVSTPDYGISPAYEYDDSAISNLMINAQTAYCKSEIIADAVSITAVQTLQKRGLFWVWSDVNGASWTKTVYANILSMSNTKTGLEDGKYRLKTVFTITNSNGETEKITVYSETVEVG